MIVIVDYGVGNLGSIRNMFKKIGASCSVSRDPAEIAKASKLILPGVGAFDTAAQKLKEFGLVPVLSERVQTHRVPILGLCVGFQLMTQSSEEGKYPGLGWFEAKTVRFQIPKEDREHRVPHMGWNDVIPSAQSRLFEGLEKPRFYFVHSFHVIAADRSIVSAQTHHAFLFDSALEKEHVAGAQFHPEKSHAFGMRFLKNFAENF